MERAKRITPTTFQVQDRLCKTCSYRRGFDWNIKDLEAQVREERPRGLIEFNNFRQCHHSDNACCRGFWNLHKDEFILGQVAQRLGMVEFVHHDNFKGK